MKGLKFFWKDRAGNKSQKSSSCSSPSSREPLNPIQEGEIRDNEPSTSIPPLQSTPQREDNSNASADAHTYDVDLLPHDPGKKIPILAFPSNDQDAARRGYIAKKTFLLGQGLACRGHDESNISNNKGNFLALLTWFAENNSDVSKVVLGNAPGNTTMTSPMIQKDLINSCAKETTRLLIDDIGGDYFGILADESSDVSQKEQTALCLCYVNKKGKISERFLGIVHIKDTMALTLKNAIEILLMDHSLSLSGVRGQGYDGASNMRGEIDGLKTLIMNENPSAYYVHCFAHQLQLTLVAVAKDNDDCIWLFEQLEILLNVIGVSCKRSFYDGC
ncbi:uncharacterized protein LOC104907650 [Beta vulgaris subsp. vulgaris]|uniref:uncharacterized protein LOC104907650 n=1 Tax=Beta vulgaris subsp. vulgaris TaxID=3555 RepID=UPI00254789C2|nr:uncharacterized protein LOC104907650 [Beta vulgaris subsp. vulgaris]